MVKGKRTSILTNLSSQQNFSLYLLIVILLIGIFFRFYNTPGRDALGGDSTRDAMVAMEGAKLLQLPLTGPFSSLGPFTFGPWYYYALIIFTRIFFVPYAPWILAGLLSTFFILVMYKIGEELIGKYFGLLVALFVTFSQAQISTATGLGNPNMISIYAGLSVLLFIRLIKKDMSLWWSFLLGILLGIGINHHYQMLSLLILPILLLVYKPRNYLYFVCISLGIFVTFLPFLFFDLNNHWYTVRNMFYYYTEGRKAIYVPNRWLFYLRDFWPGFLAYALSIRYKIGKTDISYIVSAFILIGIFGIMTWHAFKRRLTAPLALLFAAFCFDFVLLRYYWGERGYGYIQFLNPFVFLLTAYLIWNIAKIKYGKYIAAGIIVILIFFTLQDSLNYLHTQPFEIEINREVGLVKQKFPNQKVILYNCKDDNHDRAQAVSLLLAYSGRLDNSGKKVGLMDGRCVFPSNNLVKGDSIDATTEAMLFSKLYPHDTFIADLSLATPTALFQAHWYPVTPLRVFNETTRWWFKEQP